MRVFAVDKENYKDFINHLNFKNKVIYELGISTGLRISDIIRLKKHILSVKEPTIKEKKTKKSKRFYIKSDLRKDLNKIAESSLNEFIFYSAKSKSGHISRQAVWKAFKIAANKANIKINIGTQSMRKRYAKNLNYNHSYKYIQNKLNHDNISTAMLYCMDERDFKNE